LTFEVRTTPRPPQAAAPVEVDVVVNDQQRIE
jgi:glycine cleavage system regulatory protein